MRVEVRDGSAERRILVAMIVDKGTLGQVATRWDGELFKSRWSNLVAGWCCKFYLKYNEAPGKSIEGLFETWASGGNRDKDTVRMVEKFLGSLSEEYEQSAKEINTQYLVDEAGRYFNQVRIQKLSEEIANELEAIGSADADAGIERALKRIHGFNKLEIGVGQGIDVLTDVTAIQRAFEERSEPLIQYPGDLGLFFRDALERDGFIAFMGPEKRGKSFVLQDVAFRAILQRRKVAFFEVGDLSEGQIMRRFAIRAAKRPLKARTIRYPIKIEKDPDEPFADVTHEERVFDKPLSWRHAVQGFQSMLQRAKSTESLLKLSVHPNSSLSVHGMQGILRGWERQGWVPDVVVVDYADILAPAPGALDGRDAINTTWKLLRQLSQSLHCLVVTATQTNAESYKVETISRSNFSEDKRKLAHCTGMIGLNATREEKENGIIRYNWVVLREDEFSEGRCVHVAGCLALANPAIRSAL